MVPAPHDRVVIFDGNYLLLFEYRLRERAVAVSRLPVGIDIFPDPVAEVMVSRREDNAYAGIKKLFQQLRGITVFRLRGMLGHVPGYDHDPVRVQARVACGLNEARDMG